jgi:tRNA splicing endonuclease
MTDVEMNDDFLILKSKPLILKMRSLGAGVEEAEETKITYLEAAYFADRKVLPLDKETLLAHAAKNDPLAREKFAVIKYLRERGYIVRPSLDGSSFLRLHRKGLRPGEDKTYYLIEVMPRESGLDLKKLMPSLEAAGRLRKELAIAFCGPDDEKPVFVKFGRMDFE